MGKTRFSGERQRKAWCSVALLSAAAGLLLAASEASGQILARVELRWSPFITLPAPPGLSSLVTEARGLLPTDPARVAQVLSAADVPPGPEGNLLTGLRADALYAAGGSSLPEARRLYRRIVTANPSPAEAAWAHFMIGNIEKGLGFPQEATIAYRSAHEGEHGPWFPALVFDMAVLALETGRYEEGRDKFATWLDTYTEQPGRALATYLLGECRMALGELDSARAEFERASRLEPRGWLPRPEAGYAMAELMRRDGKTAEAVRILETLADAAPGTQTAARARLAAGEMWQLKGEIALAARSYARLVGGGATGEEGREAALRLALLGAEHADRIELTDPSPAYRVFYRPGPTLEEFASGREPLLAQRAMYGLAQIARKGEKPLHALGLLARVFQEYPESPESGRAYEAFMALLEDHLAERLAAGAYLDVVETYEALRKPMGWVVTRDIGSLSLRAAEAFEALGAPGAARGIYGEIGRSATRAIDGEGLRARMERTRVLEGDEGALRRRIEARGEDWRARVRLARLLASRGEIEEARRLFVSASGLMDSAEDKSAALAEANRLVLLTATPRELLEGLEGRRTLWARLSPGPVRDGWERSGAVVEARLRFAAGDFEKAARLFRDLPGRSPEDTLFFALAEARAGRTETAREILEGLREGQDPVLASLAGLHLDVWRLADSVRGSF